MEDHFPPEGDRMEAWLDDHLDFTHSYFIRKASREMVNAWFAERVHTIQPSASKEAAPLQRTHQHPVDTSASPTSAASAAASAILSSALDGRCPSPATAPSPVPGTPTRKISASEFDRPLRPIVVKDSEGSLTFLSDADREPVPVRAQVMGEGSDGGGGGRTGRAGGGDRCTRLLELVKDVSSHLDVTALCHKIFLHINELIAADRYSLFLVGEDSSNTKFLVSRLFDVAEGSTLEESSNSCIRLDWNKGIVGHVAATGQALNIKNAYEAATVPSAQSLRLLDFSFSDFELSDLETTLATVRMFVDLSLVQNFQMKYTSLCQWILSVKKNYRKNVAYHNWRHAFNTCQCMFAFLKSGRLQGNLSDLEVLALMIATLCHDLDHRGVNNSYIQRSDHPLAQLYCHSTMEHHHFDQCLMILNSPGNQILSGLSLDEYKATLKMIERAILATDLALYIKRREEFFELTKNSQFVWEDEQHRELLRSMLMTACDISAITKPWPVQKRIAELVATEFFEQGDKERQELNIEPIDLMNREKKDKIPSMQVSFIDAICTQLYETLAGLSEHCSPLLEGCRRNRQHWKRLAEEGEKDLVNGMV
ncbi:cGMP-specific 3',5'-cyclic phosphodiesterase [Lampris incognitus]|uniref:cGMP-specific 3',5'-cyclic phosphodiesterase n=1 Tax=Lampris incognitus TaxID=2546036 RepID=UPI0024B549AB|nr:cGMP-specific 3',5'-cyclic phosphodiesterase [Lampris incognitus]